MTGAGEVVDTLVPSCPAGGRQKSVQTQRKTVRPLLEILKIELPYDPAMPLLSIHPKKRRAGSLGDIFTPTFVAALFTIARRWK